MVRGPPSPIYGPGRVGGFLNFIPKSAVIDGVYLARPAAEIDGTHAFISVFGSAPAPLMRTEVPLRLTVDGTRYQATAALNTATLPAGTYVVTFELMRTDRVIGTTARTFRVETR